MAAFISRHIADLSGMYLTTMEHKGTFHPYMFIVFSYIFCPVFMIGGIMACVTVIMVPVSWIMGWL